jgi:hypothetical protein
MSAVIFVLSDACLFISDFHVPELLILGFKGLHSFFQVWCAVPASRVAAGLA